MIKAALGVFFLLFGWLCAACANNAPSNANLPDLPPNVLLYSLYFTQPEDASAGSQTDGPDEALAQAIRQARLSVDLAVYDFNLWSLRDALLDAHRRGVKVRVVTESDNLDSEEISQLHEAGIPVLGDRREGLMHNKFAIIDRQEVWSGSMNMTLASAYRHNNNLIRLHSTELAQDYTAEFEEMFVADQFGPGSPANTPFRSVSIDDTLVEVYFSPEDGTERRLVELIEDAQQRIDFLAYTFTSNDISLALVERARAGVSVSGVFDEGQSQTSGSEYERLLEAGLDVRLDGNPALMHHKVIIIDGQTVVTGSYNFTHNAETKNDENTLIIHNPQIAELFLKEFQTIYNHAR